jgi:Ribbon-helix-helix protein, copG family
MKENSSVVWFRQPDEIDDPLPSILRSQARAGWTRSQVRELNHYRLTIWPSARPLPWRGRPALTYVKSDIKMTYMEKTQVYLRKEELDALRKAAARSGRSVAEVVRDAIRKVVLKPNAAGPVAIWDGEPKRASIEHDSVHDEP